MGDRVGELWRDGSFARQGVVVAVEISSGKAKPSKFLVRVEIAAVAWRVDATLLL